MYLQLAENKKRRRGTVAVESYQRSSHVSSHGRRFPLRENKPKKNPYIFVPNFEQGGGIFIREDKFDGLTDNQWSMFMRILAPYQPQVQNGAMSEPMFLSSRAERKANRDRKREAKTSKKEAKTQSKIDKNDRKNQRTESRAEARERRADAKQSRAERKAEGGGFDWDKAKDTAGALIGKFTGGGQESAPGDGGSESSAGGFNFKSPLFIGGVALVVIGGIVYAVTRPKTA